MERSRDEFIQNDAELGPQVSYKLLPPEALRPIAAKCVEALKKADPLRGRFIKLKSNEFSQQLVEKRFLEKVLESWYVRKWSNMRSAKARDSQSPSKKRRKRDTMAGVDDGTVCCVECKNQLVCPVCTGLEVIPLWYVTI